MTSAEAALGAFMVFNVVRLGGYIPQMARIVQDEGAASGVSCLTWTIFAASNLATVLYAVLSVHDWTMACTFGANATCCVGIVVLTCHKRMAARRRARIEAAKLQAASRIWPSTSRTMSRMIAFRSKSFGV